MYTNREDNSDYFDDRSFRAWPCVKRASHCETQSIIQIGVVFLMSMAHSAKLLSLAALIIFPSPCICQHIQRVAACTTQLSDKISHSYNKFIINISHSRPIRSSYQTHPFLHIANLSSLPQYTDVDGVTTRCPTTEPLSVIIWNSLPKSVVQANSVNLFKNALR